MTIGARTIGFPVQPNGKRMLAIVACLAVSVGCGQPSMAVSPAQPRVDALIQRADAREIGLVEIVHVPSSVLTNIRLTPSALDRAYDTKFVIRELRASTFRQELTEAMRGLVVTAASEAPEVRWGIIFHDVKGTRVGAVYFNQNGTAGVVDDVPVTFNGKLFRWVEGRLVKAMD